jgi:hypothetical protein
VVVTGSVVPEGIPELIAWIGGIPVPAGAGGGTVDPRGPGVLAGGAPGADAGVLAGRLAGELEGKEGEAWVEVVDEEEEEKEEKEEEMDEARALTWRRCAIPA